MLTWFGCEHLVWVRICDSNILELVMFNFLTSSDQCFGYFDDFTLREVLLV